MVVWYEKSGFDSVNLSHLRELDPGLQEAVSTLIWAAPRLQSEVSELKIVSTDNSCNYSDGL